MSGLGVCRLFAARVGRRVVAVSAAVVGAPHAGYPARVMYSCGGQGGGRAPLHLMHNTESRPATSSWSHFVNRSYNLKTCSRRRLKPLPITCFLLEKIWTVQNTCFGTTLLVLDPRSFWINIFITVVFLQIILTIQYCEFKTSAVHLVWNRLPTSKLQFNLHFLL